MEVLTRKMIDKRVLLRSLEKKLKISYPNSFSGLYEAIELVKEMPVVETEPVRHGRWIRHGDPDDNNNCEYHCSMCRAGETHSPSVDVPFCWHCGARMTNENNFAEMNGDN